MSTRSVRKFYVLLTPKMKDYINFILKSRKHRNPYTFGRENETSPIDDCEAMRTVTKRCPNLKHEKRIRSTQLRRYLATTAQILDMKEIELKILADHLGYNVNIHTDVYRLQSSLLERSKVARILLSSEGGSIGKFKGMAVLAINPDDLPVPVDESDEEDERQLSE